MLIAIYGKTKWSSNSGVFIVSDSTLFFVTFIHKAVKMKTAFVVLLAFAMFAMQARAEVAQGTKDEWNISNNIGNFDRPGITYYLIKQEDGKWKAAKEGDVREDNVERIKVDVKNKTVYLDAPYYSSEGGLMNQYLENGRLTPTLCSSGLSNHTKPRKDGGYSICLSGFTTSDVSAVNATGSTLLAVFSFGTRLFHAVKLDAEKLKDAVLESGVAETSTNDLITYQNQQWLTAYRKEFSMATGIRIPTEQSLVMPTAAVTSKKIRQFISSYQDNDPENLVAQARETLASVEAKEKDDALYRYRDAFQAATTVFELRTFIDNYSQSDPDKLIPKAHVKLSALLAQEKIEAENTRRAQVEEAKKLVSWRKTLREGDETNCGPVLETKRGLIKVYFPVANYGSEHWIRVDQIQKAGMGCRFVNGQYAEKR